VPKSQLKLMDGLAALVVLVVLLTGALAERGLRRTEMGRIRAALEAQAGLVRALAADTPFSPESMARLDAIADRAAPTAGARVTLIAPDGTVVGDSDVLLGSLAKVENHADRPEVRAALRGSAGSATRRSETVGRRLLYVAVPVQGGAGGVVRLALDLSEVDAAVGRLRTDLAVAGAVGLAFALLLSFLLSWLALRPIREVRRGIAAIANGDLAMRIPVQMGDEVGEIATAINALAEQLRVRLADATSEKERLQTVINGMVEGVLVTDASRRVVLANDRVREVYDVWGPVVGRSVIEAIRDAELDALFDDAERGDEPVFRELHVERAGSRVLRVHAVRFPPGHGPRMGTVGVFHDVSELMRLEQVRRDFVANASHELRTPLTAIRGFAETLLGSGELSEADRRAYLEIIDRHARRLGALVDDLLELSRIEGLEAGLEPVALDVDRMVEDFVRDWGDRFAKQELRVSVQADASVPAWADPHAVDRILTNLVDNAVKYTPPGGSLALAVGADARRVRVAVTDSGIGIPQRDLSRIFERFYRVDKARSRALGGTGLGLAIVRHLVEKLGGRVSVESEPGRGSTFAFTLPRAAPAGGPIPAKPPTSD
jgi:two-component system phosphate regulon sensor histidine kinase PhoR